MAAAAADSNVCVVMDADSQIVVDVALVLATVLVGALGWYLNGWIKQYLACDGALSQKTREEESDEEEIDEAEDVDHLHAASLQLPATTTHEEEEVAEGIAAFALESGDACADSERMEDEATEASDESQETDDESSTPADRDDNDESHDSEASLILQDTQVCRSTEWNVHAAVFTPAAETEVSAPCEEQPDVLQDLAVLEVIMMAGVGARVEETMGRMNTDEDDADADVVEIAAEGVHAAVCGAQLGEFRAARLCIISACRTLLRVKYSPDDREAYVSFFERAEKIDCFMRDSEEGMCSHGFGALVEADLSLTDDEQDDGMALGASAFVQPEAEASLDGPAMAVHGITKAAQLASSGEYRAAGVEIINTNRLLQRIMRFPEHHEAYMQFIEQAEKIENFINERMAQAKAERETQ